jgi:prepilin-type processing-associated H-X9-DG protein
MVVAIIGCLTALLMPTLTALRQRANTVACASNLRHIGIAAQLYAGEHNQTMPVIEPWPDQPVYAPSQGAQNLLQALGSYGVTDALLHCPQDLAGPNYYAKEGSSYEWCPMANGQNIQSVKLVWGGNAADLSLSQLLMAFDYTNVHNNVSNVLYGDGHVGVAP